MKAWSFNGSKATGQYGSWEWLTAVHHPELGMELKHSQQSVWRWFQVAVEGGVPLRTVEAYERGADLVARYPAEGERTFTCQFDHRCLMDVDPSLFVMEHWVSVQTHLLDSNPEIQIGFREEMPLFERWGLRRYTFELAAWESNPSLMLAVAMVSGQVRSGVSVAIMVHPLDCAEIEWSGWDSSPLSLKFFGGFMEKGVIRRARMRCIVSLRRFEPHELIEQYRMFATSPLPLTA